MSLSFTRLIKPLPAPSPDCKRSVLVTGAAGNIGSYFAKHSQDKYQLRLMVHQEADTAEMSAFGETIVADLADREQLRRACDGIDTVVHLAGDPDPAAGWDSLLEANICGVHSIFTAAKAAGCRRVIFASSIHAVSGYPASVQVKSSDPVNPGDLYGVSKCFGEALGRYMAEQEGLSVIALRIGAFQPIATVRDEESLPLVEAFVSQRDLTQLLQLCVDDETLRFAIFNGLSDNRFKRLDITDAREMIGYAPEDDAFKEHPQLRSIHLDEHLPEA